MTTKFKDLKGTPDFTHFPIRQYPFLLSYTHYSVHSYTIHKSDMPSNELLCMLLCYCATVLVTFVAIYLQKGRRRKSSLKILFL